MRLGFVRDVSETITTQPFTNSHAAQGWGSIGILTLASNLSWQLLAHVQIKSRGLVCWRMGSRASHGEISKVLSAVSTLPQPQPGLEQLLPHQVLPGRVLSLEEKTRCYENSSSKEMVHCLHPFHSFVHQVPATPLVSTSVPGGETRQIGFSARPSLYPATGLSPSKRAKDNHDSGDED